MIYAHGRDVCTTASTAATLILAGVIVLLIFNRNFLRFFSCGCTRSTIHTAPFDACHLNSSKLAILLWRGWTRDIPVGVVCHQVHQKQMRNPRDMHRSTQETSVSTFHWCSRLADNAVNLRIPKTGTPQPFKMFNWWKILTIQFSSLDKSIPGPSCTTLPLIKLDPIDLIERQSETSDTVTYYIIPITTKQKRILVRLLLPQTTSAAKGQSKGQIPFYLWISKFEYVTFGWARSLLVNGRETSDCHLFVRMHQHKCVLTFVRWDVVESTKIWFVVI